MVLKRKKNHLYYFLIYTQLYHYIRILRVKTLSSAPDLRIASENVDVEILNILLKNMIKGGIPVSSVPMEF